MLKIVRDQKEVLQKQLAADQRYIDATKPYQTIREQVDEIMIANRLDQQTAEKEHRIINEQLLQDSPTSRNGSARRIIQSGASSRQKSPRYPNRRPITKAPNDSTLVQRINDAHNVSDSIQGTHLEPILQTEDSKQQKVDLSKPNQRPKEMLQELRLMVIKE